MIELFLLITNCVLIIIVLAMVVRRSSSNREAQVLSQLDTVEKGLERVERSMREEMSHNSPEGQADSRTQRDELTATLKNFNDSVLRVVSETGGGHNRELTAFGESLQSQVANITSLINGQLGIFSGQITTLTEVSEQKFDSLR